MSAVKQAFHDCISRPSCEGCEEEECLQCTREDANAGCSAPGRQSRVTDGADGGLVVREVAMC